MMLDFIFRVNELMPSWQDSEKLSLTELSQITETSVPHVLQFLSEGLGRDLEVSAIIGIEEIGEALDLLKRRNRSLIEKREKEQAKRQLKAVERYDRASNKIRILQANGQWHSAFRSLSYFAGQHEMDLPIELLVNVCSDIVRLGIKANTNMQEISQWLQRGVGLSMSLHSRAGLEDALDLVDAYGEYFLEDDTGRGTRIISNILATLEEPAARYELWEEFKQLVNQLFPAPAS